jgi:serine protease Do
MMRLFVMLCLAAIVSAAEPLPNDPLRPAMDAAMARVHPALVRIEAVWVEYHQGRAVKHEVGGSGFIITRKGYVVTNHHVAGRATRLVCILSNNQEIEATLVGTDPLCDLAVLQLHPRQPREFPAVEWGASDRVRVGDTVLAMGSPLALSQSVTRGIISNTKMMMAGSFRRAEQFTLDGENVGSLVRWLGHDAPIYPGNSGGPLVNLAGQVIGVNEISFGLGGAIPSNLARDLAAQLIERGRVSRSWLGLEVQPLPKGTGQTRGVLVAGVISDAPAAQAGIQSGDILLRLAGHDLTIRYDEEIPLLNQMVSALPVGKETDATVWREGRAVALKLRPAEREQAELKQHELKQWGLTARDISFLAGKELKLDSRQGVLVTSVRPGGPSGAGKPGLQPNDVIRAVASQPVPNAEQLIELTAALTKDKTAPVPVVVQFDRKSEQFLTVIKVGIKELEDPGAEARKAWVPIAVQAITPEMAGTNKLTGVRITQVYANSTAAAAGLKVGDLIVGLDGESIPVSQPGDEETFFSRLRQYRIGALPEFQMLRDSQPVTAKVELVRSPKLDREMKKYQNNDFEFNARDLSFFDRVRDRLAEDLPGALVTEVKDGGWAALGDLQAGDIVQSVNGAPVTDVATLEKSLKNITEQKPRFVELRVLRGIHTRYLELEPNWDNPHQPQGKP